ncbi:hypothetical protein MalM25_20610 [Planctomycetes bacterium MalM25]|nr:hypothetical protein MalM25_20610 [Planctomycetes bacterium MalM25]
MGNRLYTAAVVVFWLGAMTWLVTDRILPPFFGGDAPTTRVANQLEPVAWRIEMDGRPCGEAVLQALAGDSDIREVHSLIQLDRIEAPEAAPFWMRPMFKSLRDLSFRIRTVSTFGSLGGLSSFKTKMELNQADAPIRVNGSISGETLSLNVRIGELNKRSKHPWPKNATLGGEMTPAARLLPLWEGRSWTQEIYSPFASPKEPLEMIEATVSDRIRLSDGAENTEVWIVEYRATEKTGSTDKGRLRARLFVAEDGRVLKQEAFLLGSSVTFLRRSEEESQRIADELLELEKYATSYSIARESSTGLPSKATPAEPSPHEAEAL